MTNVIMMLILLLLALTMLYKTELVDNNEQWFSKTSTSAMRGFWSIVIILVHIPEAYQNPLQDMAGSFAYVGVTFFFMTSAYGLKLAQSAGIEKFWLRRLPKLMIPMLCVNLAAIFLTGAAPLPRLFSVDKWVIWLLSCYLIFWAVYRSACKHKDAIVCFCVMAYSMIWFTVWPNRGWPTEIYGFIWGILLANMKGRITGKISTKSWAGLCCICCIAAGILGVLYLKYKPIIFWGNYLLKICLGLAIIVLILCLNLKIRIGNQINLFLGRISYEVYLSHVTVMKCIVKIRPGLQSGQFIVASILGTLVLAAVIHEISSGILKKIKLLNKRTESYG